MIQTCAVSIQTYSISKIIHTQQYSYFTDCVYITCQIHIHTFATKPVMKLKYRIFSSKTINSTSNHRCKD